VTIATLLDANDGLAAAANDSGLASLDFALSDIDDPEVPGYRVKVYVLGTLDPKRLQQSLGR
jgi:hypothetical protein